MKGAGLGAGAGCCALAAPVNSAADAASATSVIRFMLVLPDFQQRATGVFRSERDGAPPGAAAESMPLFGRQVNVLRPAKRMAGGSAGRAMALASTCAPTGHTRFE